MSAPTTSDTPSPQPDPDNNRPSSGDSSRSLIQVAFPTSATLVMSVAVGLGVALVIAGGIAKIVNPIIDVQASMMFAVGIGLILSAFGGQANVRWGPFVLAGITATTATIFWGLNKYESQLRDEYQKGYVQGTIKDFRTNLYDAKLKNKSYVMSRVDSGEKEFNFIVLLSELSESRTRLLLTAKKKDQVEKCKDVPLNQDCELVYIFATEAFHEAWRGRSLIEWNFKKDGSLYDLKDNLIAKVQETAELAPSQPMESPARSDWAHVWQFLSPARAQGVRNQAELTKALADLTSDDVDTRRDARDVLGAGPMEWVTPIADALVEGFGNYRKKLGCLVALTEIMRQQKAKASVRDKILDKHIDPLVASAGDADRTVRVYAGEFLFDLGDKRTVLKSLKLAAANKDENIRYNLIFVTQDGIKQLDDAGLAESAGLLNSLRGGGDKTNALIQKILQSIPRSTKS